MGSYPSGANGFARVDSRRPSAFAICDRCGLRYNKVDLEWQYEWRGNTLQNLGILVCRRKCLDVPQEQLRSYSPPPDPLPVRDPRVDLSYMGLSPNVVYTIACRPAQPVLDGFGHIVLDGFGNPVFETEALPVLDGLGNYVLDGFGNLVFLGAVSFGILLPPGTGRTLVNFDLPASFGIWINPTGGICTPGLPPSQFYAPGTYYEVFGAAANNGITYFTTIAGLQIVVQSQ